jgi:hypothetical protein
MLQPHRDGRAPVNAGCLGRLCGAVGEFARSARRELGDSLLDVAHRLHLLVGAFGDLGLPAGHLDSLLADRVAVIAVGSRANGAPSRAAEAEAWRPRERPRCRQRIAALMAASQRKQSSNVTTRHQRPDVRGP